jgi:hypothetical protein
VGQGQECVPCRTLRIQFRRFLESSDRACVIEVKRAFNPLTERQEKRITISRFFINDCLSESRIRRSPCSDSGHRGTGTSREIRTFVRVMK